MEREVPRRCVLAARGWLVDEPGHDCAVRDRCARVRWAAISFASGWRSSSSSKSKSSST